MKPLRSCVLAACLMLSPAWPIMTPVFAQPMDDMAEDAPAATQPAGKAGDKPADAPAPGVDIQAINLRPMFVQGRTSRYEFWNRRQQNATIRMGANQRQMDTTMEMTGQLTWTVLAVKADGSASCTLTYDHMVLTLTLPDGSRQVNDSRQGKGAIEEIHAMLRAVAGVPVRIEMSPDGSPLSVSGTQAIRQKLASFDEELVPKDEDFLQSACELTTLPGAPASLAVGRNWAQDFDWRHAVGRLKLNVNFILADVQEIAGIPVATVEQTSRLQLVPDYSKIPADGPKVDIRQTAGSYQRQVMFDLQRHEAVGGNTTRSMTVEIRMTLPNNQLITRVMEETMQEQVLRIAEPK